jgi:hypothetical protein
MECSVTYCKYIKMRFLPGPFILDGRLGDPEGLHLTGDEGDIFMMRGIEKASERR